MYCKVSFLVKDEEVGRALRMLAGLAFDLEAVPVVNMTRTGDGKSVPATTGSLPDMFIEHLRTAKPERITRAYARDWLASIGRRVSSSASHVIKEANRRGLLKKFGGGNSVYYRLK